MLRDLSRYIRGLIDMRDPRDNMVYVVSLGDGPAGDGASITWRQIVQDKNVYFHPLGNRWPKEPWNYYGCRWDGFRRSATSRATPFLTTRTTFCPRYRPRTGAVPTSLVARAAHHPVEERPFREHLELPSSRRT
jgi:hypothetical protein